MHGIHQNTGRTLGTAGPGGGGAGGESEGSPDLSAMFITWSRLLSVQKGKRAKRGITVRRNEREDGKKERRGG